MSPIKSGKSSDLWVAVHITGLLFFYWFYCIYSLFIKYMYAFIYVIIVHLELYSLGFFILFSKSLFTIYTCTCSRNDLRYMNFSTKTFCTCIAIIEFLHFLYGVIMALFEFSRYINFLPRANQAFSYPPAWPPSNRGGAVCPR